MCERVVDTLQLLVCTEEEEFARGNAVVAGTAAPCERSLVANEAVGMDTLANMLCSTSVGAHTRAAVGAQCFKKDADDYAFAQLADVGAFVRFATSRVQHGDSHTRG